MNPKRVYRSLRDGNLLLRAQTVSSSSPPSPGTDGRSIPNLARKMDVTKLDQIRVADITYIRLQDEFVYKVIEIARTLDYFANVSLYHDWSRLILQTEDQSEILVSFHGIGYEYRGVLVASVGFYKRVETDDGERETTRASNACDTVFQMNYAENFAALEARFDRWLTEAITKALEMWRTGL